MHVYTNMYVHTTVEGMPKYIVHTCMLCGCGLFLCRLVAGDVGGNFKQLFTRIQNVLKKSGPFEVWYGIIQWVNVMLIPTSVRL